jgi:hypothetical protein
MRKLVSLRGAHLTIYHALLAFTLAAGLLTITPGIDTALVLRTAAVEGPRRAMLAALGICCGCLTWGLAASVGLGTLLAASQIAYKILHRGRLLSDLSWHEDGTAQTPTGFRSGSRFAAARVRTRCQRKRPTVVRSRTPDQPSQPEGRRFLRHIPAAVYSRRSLCDFVQHVACGHSRDRRHPLVLPAHSCDPAPLALAATAACRQNARPDDGRCARRVRTRARL